MKISTTNTELDYLIRKIGTAITEHSTAIFCGAGISYNSGLPLANDLIKEILTAIDITEDASSLILNSGLPFESFIETLHDEVSVDDILDIYSKGEPNTNHELIADLVKAGFIKTIITTNFDLLIEKALTYKGLEKGKQFEVYSTEKEFEKIVWNNSKTKLVKIHGCISNKTEMGITLNAVAKKTNSQSKNKIIESFFSQQINSNVIVMGYSCSDLFDISPQIELIEKERSEIFFIEHAGNTVDPKIEEISSKVFKNPFQSFIGKRIYINADLFVKQIWENLSISKYELKFSSIPWIENVSNWMTQTIKYSDGIKNHISARLFYAIGEYNFSVRYWESGINIAQRERNQVFFYSQLGNLGMAFNALGRYNDAKRCLQESVTACYQIGNLQGEIAQLQALGNVHRNLRDFDASIKVFERAIYLAEKNELDGLCASLGNLASVYNQVGKPDEAIKTLTKGIAIALATGNKQSEGSMLCSLGIAYFQSADFEKARNYIQQSVITTKLIGDKQGECMALLNLSNLSLQFEDYDDCLKNAGLALQIAKKIGIRQSEAGAYYNIGSSYFFKGEVQSSILNLKKSIDIYSDIYGKDHAHTLVATNALYRAENHPGLNEMTKLDLL